MSADAAREAGEALLAHLDRFRWACLTNSAAGSYTRDTEKGLTDLYRLKNEMRAALAAPVPADDALRAERVKTLRAAARWLKGGAVVNLHDIGRTLTTQDFQECVMTSLQMFADQFEQMADREAAAPRAGQKSDFPTEPANEVQTGARSAPSEGV